MRPIAAVRRALPPEVLVLANGGIETRGDAEACIIDTGVDGVAAAEGLLENPALAEGGELTDLQRLGLASEYLALCRQMPSNLPYPPYKPHLLKILYRYLECDDELHERFSRTKGTDLDSIEAFVALLAARLQEGNLPAGTPWYRRWREGKRLVQQVANPRKRPQRRGPRF
mmetsp:Transcript_74977/g.171865  ORF Transcript_74977/g.171865 Transcript_74977/m.171865 type:complete len:171 (-) Transcript_74977:9-521(-)